MGKTDSYSRDGGEKGTRTVWIFYFVFFLNLGREGGREGGRVGSMKALLRLLMHY